VKVQDQPMYAVVADKNTLILAHSKEEAVDRATNGGRQAKISKHMESALRQFKGKESMVMALLVTDDMKKQMDKLPPQFSGLVSKMKTVTASLVVANDLTLTVNGHTGEPKSARQVAANLELFKAAASAILAGMDDLPPGVLDALNEVKVESTKDSAVLKLKLSKDQLDKLGKGQ